MKRICAIVVLLLIALANMGICQDNWQNCAQGPAHYTIQKLSFTPYPPVIGQNLTLFTSGTIDETITGGKTNFTVQYDIEGVWISLPTFHFVNCQLVKCPLQQGPVQFTSQIPIPGLTLSGQYRGKMVTVDQNNQLVACLTYNVTMVA